MEATSPGHWDFNIGFTLAGQEFYRQADFPEDSTSNFDVSPATISFSKTINIGEVNSRVSGRSIHNSMIESESPSTYICPINGSCFGKNAGNKSFDLGEDVEGQGWDSLWTVIPIGIVLAFLCLLTTAGNIMVLHAVRTEKRLQTVSNLFIVSLAVADVIVGIIVMPMSAVYIFTERWLMGVAVCQIWIGVDYIASTASILNLFILSLDRYWSVRQPLKYLHKRTKRRALSMIAVVWLVSSLWIIPIASWHYIAHGGVRTVPHDTCDTEYAKNSLFKVITAFFNFYLPLSVMFILYFRIFIAIRKRSKFEMGHRYPGGTVISFKPSNNVTGMHSLDESDYMNGEADSSFYHGHQQQGESHLSRSGSRQNGTRNTIPNGCRNLRLLASACPIRGRAASGNGNIGRGRGRGVHSGDLRGGRGANGNGKRLDFNPSSSSRYKVEYIYDENVMDPQTEKIERYFYEDSYPLQRTNRNRWTTSTSINNDSKTVSSKSSSIPTTTSSSSSSTFPSAQRSVRFRSSLHPVNETKVTQRLSVPPAKYHCVYNDSTCGKECHQQQSRSHKQKSPPEHFMTVGGKTTAVLKRNLFKRQKNLDEDESKTCLRGGSKAAECKGNEKSRSKLKLEKFRRHKPAETSFSPSLAVNASSSLSSSSASTFGDSTESKWVVESCGTQRGGGDNGCGGCGNGRGESSSSRNSRAGCGCCLQIDDQIRLDTPTLTANTNFSQHTTNPPSPGGLRIHRGREVISGNGAEMNRTGASSSSKTESTGCCGCRRVKSAENDDDDDEEDDDDAELSSFSLSTRCDIKARRGTGVGATSERVGVASSTGGVSGLKERLKTMRQSSSLNKEIKAARQLGVIMGAFTLCFLPYFILFMVVAFCDDCVSPGHLTLATWVGYLNSTLNPFLYPLCNANFRVKFRSMLSCCGKGHSTSGRLGVRRRNHDFARTSVYHSRYD